MRESARTGILDGAILLVLEALSQRLEHGLAPVNNVEEEGKLVPLVGPTAAPLVEEHANLWREVREARGGKGKRRIGTR